MDPLDPEYSFKFLTNGAPLRVEKLLDLEVKPGAFKTATIIGSITVGVVATAAAAYYWLNSPEEEDEDQSEDDSDSDDTIITTTTTTTTSYDMMSSNTPSSTTTTTTLPPIRTINTNSIKSSQTIEEQNRLLLIENRLLKKDVENLRNFITDKVSEFEDKFKRMEIANEKKVRDLESELDKERHCFVCQENEKQVCWTSCGHRLCSRCAIVIKSSVQYPTCPMCRRPVDNFVHCYNT